MSETGVRFIDPPMPNDRIVAIEVVGTVTREEMQQVLARIETIVERGEKALLYQELAGFDGVEWGALVEKTKSMDTLWKGVERIAVVSKSKAYRFGVDKITDALTPMDMKSFEPQERDAAFAWLTEAPGESAPD